MLLLVEVKVAVWQCGSVVVTVGRNDNEDKSEGGSVADRLRRLILFLLLNTVIIFKDFSLMEKSFYAHTNRLSSAF